MLYVKEILKKEVILIVSVWVKQVSFSEEALCENVGAFVNALLVAKPAGLKKSKHQTQPPHQL